MQPTAPKRNKPCLVLLTDAWGPKYGGINSFNMDFAKALGLLLSATHQVICVVLAATDDERADALRKHVHLLCVGRSEKHGHFEASRAAEVITAVRAAAPDASVLWWIGHDTFTDALALKLPKAAGEGQCALINHMSYQDYVSYKDGVGAKAKTKVTRQRTMFTQADKVFAVGPILRSRLADLLGKAPETVPMLVPGLAEIEPGLHPSQFTGITFGRLDPENDRIKQGWLAAAAFASAYAEAHKFPAKLQAYRSQPVLHLIGLAEAGGTEEAKLHQFVEGKAEAVLSLLSVPYDDDREQVFRQLRSCSLAMMLSWHEGFGLTGWEAIAAGVPLIVSENSGVYQLIDERLGGSGTGCLHAVKIRGKSGEEVGQNFKDEDEVSARNAVLKIAGEPTRAKKDALRLREQLLDKNFTWQNTARYVATELGIELEEPQLPVALVPRDNDAISSASASPTTNKLPMAATPTDILELRAPSTLVDRSFAVSYLLRAEEECVPFHDQRRGLVREVLDWASPVEASSVCLQLRIGAGGAGKTRLMRQVCSELAAQGWRAGFLRMGESRDVRRAVEQLLRSAENTLIVVNYAEGRTVEILDLVQAALQASKEHSVRIVLLAREAGEWWQRLPNERKELEPFLSGLYVSGPYRMPAVTTDTQAREAMFDEAVTAYGARLGRSSAEIKRPDLSASHFCDVIYIHLSALSSLLGEQPDTASGLLDSILHHELRYWRQAGQPIGLERAEDCLAQAMLALTLCNGARTRADARKLLKKIPRLGALTSDQRDRIIDVLHGFYPDGSGVDALRPDVLGERLVARELPRDDEPLDQLLGTESDDLTREAVLTVLNRLAMRQPGQIVWLKAALERHLVEVTRATVKVAIAAGQPIGNLFAEVMTKASKPQQAQTADRLLPLLPEQTEALAEVALLVAKLRFERLTAKGPPKNDKQRQDLMAAYRTLAARHYSLGHFEDALSAAEADERLAAQTQGAAAHAGALANLGVSLSALRRVDAALKRSQAALAIWRRLALQHRDAYRADLATSLNNTANHLRDVGQYEQALSLCREALEIRRSLASQRPDAYRADLASSLSNTANHLRDVGQYEQGLTLAREALEIRRSLASQRPDAYRADLATSLSNTASHLSDVGQYEQGLTLAHEALEILRSLASQRPDVHSADLARSLSTTANRLSDVGQYEQGLALSREALEIYRSLASQRPDVHRADLARSLSTTAHRLSAVGQYEQGLTLAREALEIRRSLASQRPDVHRADLARSLSTTASHLSDVGQYEQGLTRSREALEIYRSLASQRPDVHRADLATSLSNTASHLSDVGQYEQGLTLSREALEIRRSLASQRPDVHRADLATSLSNTASHLSDVGQYEQGLSLSREALEIHRSLASQRPDAYSPDLARSLSVYGQLQLQSDALDAGLVSTREAGKLLRLQAQSHGELPYRDMLAYTCAVEAALQLGKREAAAARAVALDGLKVLDADLALRPRKFHPKLALQLGSLVDAVRSTGEHLQYQRVLASLQS